MRILKVSRFSLSVLLLTAALTSSHGCARSYDETIAGVTVPVPNGMTRSAEKPVEISLLGFGAGQAVFHGNMETKRLSSSIRPSCPPAAGSRT